MPSSLTSLGRFPKSSTASKTVNVTALNILLVGDNDYNETNQKNDLPDNYDLEL